LIHKLHSSGIGRKTRQAEVILAEDEKLLMQSGVMNTTTPRGLLNAAFLLSERCFASGVAKNTGF
jgi:hypothetical protein